MKYFVQDIEQLKKELWALRKQVESGGSGGSLEEIESKITAIEEKIALLEALDGRLTTLETSVSKKFALVDENSAAISINTTSIEKNSENVAANTASISTNTAAIAANKSAIESNDSDIEGLKTSVDSLEEGLERSLDGLSSQINAVTVDVSTLRNDITELEAKIPDSSAGGITLGTVVPFTGIVSNEGSGYMDFIVSSSRKIRMVYGLINCKSTVTFDVPFSELIWAISSNAAYSTTAVQRATIGSLSTTSMAFVAGGTALVRYEVWGYIDL